MTGIDTTYTEEGSDTRLTANLLVGGGAATFMEALVARLSLEPGIHDVHWHSADEPDLASTLAVSHEESGPPDQE